MLGNLTKWSEVNLSLRNLAIAAGLQVNRSHRKLDDDESIVEGMVMMMIVMMMVACRHIPTMTKSHHGREISVMIKVGMCQCQIPTIHDKL